jgi:PAS domain S-box-containing protein
MGKKTENPSTTPQPGRLRRQAEQHLRAKKTPPVEGSAESDARDLLHELQVHQIELEMQNEELRRAQAELEASRARYFDLYDLAPVGYVTLSAKGLILEANLTAATLLGVAKRDHLVKQLLSRYVLSEDQNIYYWLRKRLSETGAPQVCELRMMRTDGTHFWAKLDASAVQDADGTRLSRVVMSDVTARKQADEIRQSEQLYRSLVDNIDAGITLIDPSHTIIAVNPAHSQMFGKDAADSLGRKCYREFEKRDSVCAHCPGVVAMATHEPAETETEGARDDGSRFFARVRAFPIFGPDGAAAGFIELVEDVTELKKAERRLIQANHMAQAANRAKSEFLANMSHEIRTPMTAILGFADLLDAEMECCFACREGAMCQHQQNGREAVSTIQRNGRHLLDVINDILDLSKIEAEKFQIEPVRCSPVQLVADVLSLLRPQAVEKHLSLKTELSHPLPEAIVTDPLRLRQVLVNLVGNAIKFTDQGEVRLAVRLNADDGRSYLCFDVVDTGIGMNEEQVGNLFRPFSQVDNSSTRRFGGTGLGLCISKHLAEVLGGSIKVRSEPGKGSTFSLTIDPGPLDKRYVIHNAQKPMLDRAPTTIAATSTGIALHGRILLAEDRIENQRLVALLLRKGGAEVTAVENGQLAVEAALAAREAGEPFDVILMDMQMPVLDGYEATRQLRKLGCTSPIVALTAHAMAEDYQICLDAGCNDYLPKPFQHSDLLEVVARHITAEKDGGPHMPDYARSSTGGR